MTLRKNLYLNEGGNLCEDGDADCHVQLHPKGFKMADKEAEELGILDDPAYNADLVTTLDTEETPSGEDAIDTPSRTVAVASATMTPASQPAKAVEPAKPKDKPPKKPKEVADDKPAPETIHLFKRIPNVTPALAEALAAKFPDLTALHGAADADIMSISGIGPAIVRSIREFKAE